MPLTDRDRLEAELNVVADDLGMTEAQFEARIDVWTELATERDAVTLAQQYEHVKALLLRSWIVALMRKSDEFEAVGDIKRKTNILGRVQQFEALERVALRNADLLIEVLGPVAANPAPVIGGWGVEYGD
ncbi:hypothetical protein GCM10022631_11300 [Deinococcus rubellus]|uniref:hypothetical protein n=1 Tax=Deinococcus rubellus TaxID=1889240 RepID=UPI0031E728F4